MAANVDAWIEQTPIVAGDRVLIYDTMSIGTVKDVIVDKPAPLMSVGQTRYVVEDENGHLRTLIAGAEIEWYGVQPHTTVFWFPASDEDKAWVKSHMREVAECGFRVFSFDEWGLGITVNEYRAQSGLLPERIRDGCWMRLFRVKEGRTLDELMKDAGYSWLDSNTFCLTFDGGVDEDGEVFSYCCEYWKDTDEWRFQREYEDQTIPATLSESEMAQIKKRMMKLMNKKEG